MLKYSVAVLISIVCFTSLQAQQTREELERQRAQLKKEIQETQKLYDVNKSQTKENFLQWKLISNKVDLQDKVVNNLNKNLRLLDDNIYLIQKDINRYDRLLDTLKREYANSMVYAYKNRSNYDFLNFIFSADNFNDAVKRVAYLKSYRDYREMQGQNIMRMQDLRRKRVEDLTGAKKQKTVTLNEQSSELKELETQQKEKDRVVTELKKQGNQISGQLAAKQKQMQKVSSAIAAAIKRAQEEARKAAMAKATEEKRKERDRLAALQREEEEKRKAAARLANQNNNAGTPTTNPPPPTKTERTRLTASDEPPTVKQPESILLNDENIALDASFERNRGNLPWPVDNGYALMHYGPNKLPGGGDFNNPGVTISANIGTPVKAVFDGVVSDVIQIDEMSVVIIQHGRYFTSYSNLSGVTVSKGQQVKRGQVLGKVLANLDGIGAMDFLMSDDKREVNPERWLRAR